MTTSIIEFPGLGIGPFTVEQRAFSILGRDVAWYGILISVGIILALIYAIWRGRKNGINPDDMIDVGIFCIPAAVIGARLYYVVFSLDQFPTFLSILQIWNGGLAIYGGIIFGFIACFFVCKFKKISMLTVYDSAVPAIMIGQIIGRFGNFTNGEAFGSVTKLPWRMSVQNSLTYNQKWEVHPTFLYESLWNLIGFILINIFYKKRKFDGQITLFYIIWYGLGRMFIEGLRTDSLTVGETRVSQIFAGMCFVLGLTAMIILSVKKRNLKLTSEGYSSLYSTEPIIAESEDENKQETENVELQENIQAFENMQEPLNDDGHVTEEKEE